MSVFKSICKSIYKSTNQPVLSRLLATVLVLVHLIALLLPTSTASAAGPRCGGGTPEAASVAAAALPAADEQVKIPKKEVDKAVFVANWYDKLEDAYTAESIVFDLFIVSKYTADTKLDNAYFTQFREDYRERIQFDSETLQFADHRDIVVHTILNEALDRPDLAPAVPHVLKAIMQRAAETGFDADQRIGQSAGRYELTEHLLARGPELIAHVYECAHQYPEVAAAFDRFHSEALGVSVNDSAQDILIRNSNLTVMAELRARLGEDGSLTLSLDELKKLSQEEFAKLHTSIDGIQKTLTEIDEKQDVIIDYLKDQQERAKDQELAQKKHAEYQLKLQAIGASLSMITLLAEQIDPEFARDFAVVANSSLQVGAALNKWLEAVAGLNGLDKVASLSTVVMTGDVVGAVMNLMTLFGEAQPTPDQIILEEIGKLREQIEQLRVEMHDRFDRIDVGLNAIYTTMHDRFDQIDLQLGKINGNIRDIQYSLLNLDLKLSHFERNNFEMINAVGRRDLLKAINGGLGYQERTGLQMPYDPDFIDFENEFHTWGTVHAYDPANAGPTQRAYGDANVLEELTKYPLDLNLNYLNGWLIAHDLPALTEMQLASSRDWLFASRAYMQLGLEWPAHMKAVDPARQDMLDQVGYEIGAAIQNISTRQTAAGPVGNTLLFSSVITYYQEKLDGLDSAIQQVEQAYITEVQLNRLQRAEAFNLYGGIDQPLTYVAPELINATCGNADAHGSVPAPSNLSSLLPNYARYVLADYLKLGQLKVCVQYEKAFEDEVCFTEPDPPYAEICETYYGAKAVATVYFDNVSVMSLTSNVTGGYLLPDWEYYYGQLMPRWTEGDNFKAQIEARTAPDVPSPEVAAQRAELLNTVTKKLESTLASLQQEQYAKILNEASTGLLKGPATEVGGGKELIESFSTLGLPRAINKDEFLHAMLFGEQQLVDDGDLLNSYAISLTQPITGTMLLVNPRLVMTQVADERTAAFSAMIDEYLTAITARTHAEAADYIASTRRMLDLSIRIAQLDVPPATPDTPGTPDSPGTPDTPTPPTTPLPPVTPVPPTTPMPPLPANAQHNYLPSVER